MASQLQTKRCETDQRRMFCYEALDPKVAKFLRGQAERLRRCTATSAIQIGKGLIVAKHYLNHGQFLRWVEQEIGIPSRTAQGYMRLANWASGKSATIAHLPPTVLYLLSAPSTPGRFVDDVLCRFEAGKEVPLLGIRAELKALRAGARSGSRQDAAAIEDHAVDESIELAPLRACEEGAMHEIASILLRYLPDEQFVRVRSILLSRAVVEDEQLAQSIADAFESVGAAQTSYSLSAERPPPSRDRAQQVGLHR